VELGAGFNLAVVQCGAGQRDRALATLDRILRFAPDNDRARTMAHDIRAGKQPCAAR
jgi:predicted Zn-dependent protease